MSRVLFVIALFAPSFAFAVEPSSKPAEEPPISNAELIRQLNRPAPGSKEVLERRARADAAVMALRKKDEDRRMARWKAHDDLLRSYNEQQAAEYNAWVKHHNELVDTYEHARADSWGRFDAAWELQRRTMEYDSMLYGGGYGFTYTLPPVFIGAYGHP